MKGLLPFGTAEQRARYLPRLASGELIAAFCLTEPGAGSDAASVRTTARRQSDGRWRLDGEKFWITNGGIADLYTVFARTDEDGGKMSAFIVEAAWAGVTHGTHEDKMGIRASSTTTVSFTDVQVPAENLLGEPGKGFKIAMAILNSGRTGLGGGAVGGMKSLLAMSTRHALERRQFGRSIADFGLVRQKLAQMAVDCFAAESTVWMVAHYVDSGVEDYWVEAAMSKVFASDAMTVRPTKPCRSPAGRPSCARTATNRPPAMPAPCRSSRHQRDPADVCRHVRPEAGRSVPRGTALCAGRHLQPSHVRGIVDRQADLARLAGVAIGLFVGLCTLSRALNPQVLGGGSPTQAAAMARTFARQARRRMAASLRRLNRNEDDVMDAVATELIDKEGYRWDVV